MYYSKKSFLLVFLIPLFAFFQYITALCFKSNFVWWDIVFFAAFIVSAIALLSVGKKAVSYLVAVVVQAVPAVCAVTGLMQGDIALKHYAAYAVMCLPVLPILAAATAVRSGASAAVTGKKRGKQKYNISTSFVTVLIFIMMLILIAALIVCAVAIVKQLRAPDNRQIDYIVPCFAVLVAILSGIIAYLLKNKKTKQSTIVLMSVLCFLALLEEIAYMLWFADIELSFVQIFFPLIATAVLLLEPFPRAGQPGTAKK